MLDPSLSHWLDSQAEALDTGACDPDTLLQALSQAGLPKVGVDRALGGDGGTLHDAIETVAAVAGHSLTAAFVLWGQRAFIEYVLHTPNEALRQATESGWRLDGRLPWVTNLRRQGFLVAAAVEAGEGQPPLVLAIPDGLAGLARSADLDLLGLQGSNTAALDLAGVELDRAWLLHEDARRFLPGVRPAFLGLQCGMALGLARRCLDEVQAHLGDGGGRALLEAELGTQRTRLEALARELHQGLDEGRFLAQPAAQFRLRIGLAESVADAIQLELQASGGKAYLSEHGAGFARRWRGSAFVPIVTPSLVQLRTELNRQAREVVA